MAKVLSKSQVELQLTSRLEKYFNVDPKHASVAQVYECIAMLVNDTLLVKKEAFNTKVRKKKGKKVHYFSMEFLLGKSLKNHLFNLQIEDAVADVLKKYDFSLNDVYFYEPDAALGNGGLGRLAACFMDALSSRDYPATGHSIKYEYGLFKQKIVDGQQTMLPDEWLSQGRVWLLPRPDKACTVKFNGYVKEVYNEEGNLKPFYYDYTEVEAFPFDMLISGYDSSGVSTLRLWEARGLNKFDMKMFSQGQYAKAIENDAEIELISKVLYPSDDHMAGKMLRLKQQYFLVSAALQSIVNSHISQYRGIANLQNEIAIHINDTHPVLCVPELMRILMDDYSLSWDDSFEMVKNMVSYTNHTILQEALEQWDKNLISTMLPRIYQILEELNRRFCISLMNNGQNFSMDTIANMAIINNNQVKMANLAVMVSHTVNGVSALHSSIIKTKLFESFSALEPHKFINITNGIAHRRWLCQSNKRLVELLSSTIGKAFIKDASALKKFNKFAEDKTLLKEVHKTKLQNKKDFVEYLYRVQGEIVDPTTRFDVHVKRIHEYKRQLLNVLKIIYLYEMLKQNPKMEFTPQTFFFGGKAAGTYFIANRIIKLINQLSADINKRADIVKKLKVVFIENYNVSVAEKLIPATEVSQQISLAGKEASGTGNMKFMMNGAITMGTYDGANIEIAQNCGEDNIFIFGMDNKGVEKAWKNYSPKELYKSHPKIKLVLDSLKVGYNGESFADIFDYLLNGNYADPYMCLADFESYLSAHYQMDEKYADAQTWSKMCVHNIATSGFFAADRSIEEYATKIWKLKPYTI